MSANDAWIEVDAVDCKVYMAYKGALWVWGEGGRDVREGGRGEAQMLGPGVLLLERAKRASSKR